MRKKYISVLAASAIIASANAVNVQLSEAGSNYANPTAAAPQSGACTGTVTDQDGEPLIGATVKVEGTSLVAATDIDGKFSFSGITPGAKVTVSFIGCKPQTIT